MILKVERQGFLMVPKSGQKLIIMMEILLFKTYSHFRWRTLYSNEWFFSSQMEVGDQMFVRLQEGALKGGGTHPFTSLVGMLAGHFHATSKPAAVGYSRQPQPDEI